MAGERGRPAASGGSLPDLKRLGRLPQTAAVWQIDVCPVPVPATGENGAAPPWMTLAVSATEEQVLAYDLTPEAPTDAQVWQTVLRALTEPAAGRPHRPAVLQIRAGGRAEALEPVLRLLGIDVNSADVLDVVDGVFAELTEQMADASQPGLLDVPGLTPEAVGRFFAAAAAYYRKAPWKKFGEEPIRVTCARFPAPWFAVMTGQGGMMRGLALYDDAQALARIQQEDLSEEECARLTSAVAVVFGEEDDLALADLDAAERFGWEVAGPKAYPAVYRTEPELVMRPPQLEELELLEGCLLALPIFLKRRPQPEDLTAEEVTVPVASGELKLVLAWADELER